MGNGAWALIVATLLVAVVDWYAVGADNRKLEYVAKPATMVMLFLAAVAIEPHDETVQLWFLVAIVFSLGGDIFLMLPKDLFVFGLGSFLVGHLAYIAGLQVDGVEVLPFVLGVGLVVLAMASLGRRILRAVRSSDDPSLAGPVAVYILVISAMVASAVGVGRVAAIVGASLFYVSDATIAWTRFIQDFRFGRLAIMVTYHLGQIGLVLSLAD